MADLHYLIDKQREEELRTTKRMISFENGDTELIEAYRLVWDWYDRLLACTYTFDQEDIIAMILRCAKYEGLSMSDALTRVVSVLVARLDRDGVDVTDDSLQLDIARKQMEKWDARKVGRQSGRE